MTVDQSTWNLLFGWTGRRCMIPEGCSIPVEGAAGYTAALLLVAAASYIVYQRREELERWIK